MDDPGNELTAVEDAIENANRAVSRTIAEIAQGATDRDVNKTLDECRTLESQGRHITRLCEAVLTGAEPRWIGQALHAAEQVTARDDERPTAEPSTEKQNKKLASALSRLAQSNNETPEIVDQMRSALHTAAQARTGQAWLDDEQKMT